MNTNANKSNDAETLAGPPAVGDVALHQESAREQAFDFWRTAHRSLRGRYRTALLIAAIGGLVGACVGGLLGQRLYSATGLVRIASVLPQVMRQTDQNKPMENFDGFIAAQRDVMSSREIIEAAMASDSWKKVSGAGGALSGEQFASRLKVETKPRSDYLRVTFANGNPTVAAAGVRSIVTAYKEAFIREQDRVESQRMGQIQNRRASLTSDLQKIEADMTAVADGRSADEVEPLYVAAVDRVKKLRGALLDVQCALAGGPALSPGQGGSSRLPSDVVSDEVLRSYIAEQMRVESQLLDARRRGLISQNPVIERLEAAVQQSRERVSRYVESYGTTDADGSPRTSSLALSQREASLQDSTRTAEDEMKRLAAQRAQLATLETRATSVRQNLEETNSRLDALATEAALGSRLTVVSDGGKPMTALLDNRAKVAAAAALLGMAAPLAVFILGGAFKRRYRFGDEVAADLMDRVPFVSVLPHVSDDGALSHLAAHCLHDLRVRLQPPASSTPRTYLTTSVAAGEGKSGLAVALGLSFAAAGYRTLLIDCDLKSRQLTRGFDVNDSQGLVEAAAGGDPLIWRLRAGSCLMAAGQCSRRDIYNLAPAAMGRVLASFRDQFDIVLIDSDSILTGIASSVIAPQVDGVILTLSRGQEPSLVRSAVTRIQMLGADISGVVFNGAVESEFRAVMQEHSPGADTRAMPDRLNRFGPLVCAMLSSLSFTREEDLELMPAGMAQANSSGAQRAVA